MAKLQRAVKWAAVLVAIFAIGIAAVVVIEDRAEARARAFCDRFPVGTPLQAVAEAARSEGHAKFRILRADHISIAHIGVTPFSRHVCAFDAQDGKVAKVWYVYLE